MYSKVLFRWKGGRNHPYFRGGGWREEDPVFDLPVYQDVPELVEDFARALADSGKFTDIEIQTERWESRRIESRRVESTAPAQREELLRRAEEKIENLKEGLADQADPPAPPRPKRWWRP